MFSIGHEFLNIHWIYTAQDGKVCLQGVYGDYLEINLEEALYLCIPKLLKNCASQVVKTS